MIVLPVTYEFISPTQIRFTYSSDLDSPRFYVYVNGDFVGETFDTTYDVPVPPGGQVQFDVFDDPDDEPEEYFPAQLTLRWLGRDGATAYRVEEYAGGSWAYRATIVAHAANLYRYTTRSLDDVTTYQFRVVPLDAEGRSGTVLPFTVEMVRYPDAPSQEMTFVSGELYIT